MFSDLLEETSSRKFLGGKSHMMHSRPKAVSTDLQRKIWNISEESPSHLTLVLAIQSVIHRPAASASQVSFFEMQVLGSQVKYNDSELML